MTAVSELRNPEAYRDVSRTGFAHVAHINYMVVGYESSLLEKEYAFQSAMENISAAKEQLRLVLATKEVEESGTRRCLEKHISKGLHIPQAVVDQLKADEIKFKIELNDLEVTIITENNMVLSPIISDQADWPASFSCKLLQFE
ncbi:hypothetical protein HID58_037733 [Brassica napus]|uniref:Uncharacterized protein n=2 Tax=Brassica TaxID=3705 RepID=A0ABQ8BM42_BRANA|nr:hypothetical protein HID58_037733 [Brassica napus]